MKGMAIGLTYPRIISVEIIGLNWMKRLWHNRFTGISGYICTEWARSPSFTVFMRIDDAEHIVFEYAIIFIIGTITALKLSEL